MRKTPNPAPSRPSPLRDLRVNQQGIAAPRDWSISREDREEAKGAKIGLGYRLKKKIGRHSKLDLETSKLWPR
jgi:hypothetical protein